MSNIEEFELIKKHFIEKEKENITLKEEINFLKTKFDTIQNFALNFESNQNSQINSQAKINENKKIIFSPICTEENLNHISKPSLSKRNSTQRDFYGNFQTEFIQKSPDLSKLKISELQIEEKEDIIKTSKLKKLNHLSFLEALNTSPIIKSNASSQLNSPRGRNQNPINIIFDKKGNEERSKSTNNIVRMNKTVINNIASNITELKSHLNNYEKAYENINKRLDCNSNSNEKFKIENLENLNNELNSKINNNDSDMQLLKQSYEKKIKILLSKHKEQM